MMQVVGVNNRFLLKCGRGEWNRREQQKTFRKNTEVLWVDVLIFTLQ